MISRNEKTGRFESTKEAIQEATPTAVDYENAIAEAEAKLAALKKAQAEKVEAEKKAISDTRKEEAEKVKFTITERLTAETEAKKAKAKAYQDYLKACEDAEALVAEKKKIESEALNDFCKKYGAFHDTIKIGDITYTCNYSTDKVSLVDPFRRIFDFPFNIF